LPDFTETICLELLLGLSNTGILLSDIEWKMVGCLFSGLDGPQMAEAVGLTYCAIKMRMGRLCRKAKVANQMKLVAMAYKHSSLYVKKQGE
jgi:ATP/maltotriose-dependent transcriptional regulator MalT